MPRLNVSNSWIGPAHGWNNPHRADPPPPAPPRPAPPRSCAKRPQPRASCARGRWRWRRTWRPPACSWWPRSRARRWRRRRARRAVPRWPPALRPRRSGGGWRARWRRGSARRRSAPRSWTPWAGGRGGGLLGASVLRRVRGSVVAPALAPASAHAHADLRACRELAGVRASLADEQAARERAEARLAEVQRSVAASASTGGRPGSCVGTGKCLLPAA